MQLRKTQLESVRKALFLISTIVIFALQYTELIVIYVAYIGVYVCWRSRDASFTRLQVAMFCAAAFMFFPAFLKPYYAYSPVFYMFETLVLFLLAEDLSRDKDSLLKALTFTYRACVVFIAYVLFFYWDDPAPFSRVIEGSSTNGIPSYLVIIQVTYSLVYYVVRKRLPVYSVFITGMVAFFGNGRGSLVVAGLLILSTVTFNLFLEQKGRWGRARYVSILVAATFLLVIFGEQLFEGLLKYTKLSVGLVDTNRLEIFDAYEEKIDSLSFFLGANYHHTIIEFDHDNNPHISYIRLHSFYGLFVTLIAIFSPLIPFFSKKDMKARFIFAAFTGMAALRAGSEPVLFPTLLDMFYFLCFFTFFRALPDGYSFRESPGSQLCARGV